MIFVILSKQKDSNKKRCVETNVCCAGGKNNRRVFGLIVYVQRVSSDYMDGLNHIKNIWPAVRMLFMNLFIVTKDNKFC